MENRGYFTKSIASTIYEDSIKLEIEIPSQVPKLEQNQAVFSSTTHVPALLGHEQDSLHELDRKTFKLQLESH